MDVTIHAYSSFDELLFYCKHSANPVGRLMLALHGVNDPLAIRCSDHICSALQLINFWQDLSIDLPRGRCYLPQVWLQGAGLSSEQLLDGQVSHEQLQPALKQALQITSDLLEDGLPLLALLPFRLRLQIAATIHAGRRMLAKIEAVEALQERVSLSRAEFRSLFWPVLKDSLFPSRANKRKPV